jgi:ParB-like chromosome segregation protein Spo0J
MSKFSINSLKGNKDGKSLNIGVIEGESKVRLGEGLLNEASKDIIKMRIVNLDRNKIKTNPKNKYSINDIDSLAESIRNYGIASPLNVKKINDNEYMLLGGERRITAIDELIKNPNVTEWNENTLIPCIIKDLDKIKLPLSDDAKEQYALVTTNKESRKYTDSDKYIEVQAWKKIIDELRANGIDVINMENKDIQIKGEKTRDILVKATGMSRGQIQRYDKIENNATENLINSVLDDEISIGVAERAVDILTPMEQDNLAKAAKKQKIAPIDVDNFKQEEPKEEYTDKVHSDVEELLNNIRDNTIYFTKKQEREYTKLIKKLTNILTDN